MHEAEGDRGGDAAEVAGGGQPRVEEVRFPSGDGFCVGELHLPPVPRTRTASPPAPSGPRSGAGDRGPAADPKSADPAPFPALAMAPGIGAERAFGFAAYARRFAAMGIAALLFDYRHHGGSPGTPRRLVSPERQKEDYREALAFLRGDPRVDANRLGLWGTSFSGGHVLSVGAEDPPGVRCIVSQVPFVSGVSSTLAYPLRYHLRAIALGAADALRGALSMAPLEVPVVRERGLALLASPDSHPGYMAMVPEGSEWPNRVPARTLLQVLRYHPGREARGLRIPTLLVVAEGDALCPPRATLRMARKLPSSRAVGLPMGHFGPYQGQGFEEVVSREETFLREHLLPG